MMKFDSNCENRMDFYALDKQCLLAIPSVCRKLRRQRHPKDNCIPGLCELFSSCNQKKNLVHLSLLFVCICMTIDVVHFYFHRPTCYVRSQS